MLIGLGLVVQIMTAALKVRSVFDSPDLDASDLDALAAMQKALVSLDQAAGAVSGAETPPRLSLEADALTLSAFGEALGGYVYATDEARTRPQRIARYLSGETAGEHDELPAGARSWGASLLNRFRGRESALQDELKARLQAVLDRGGAGGQPHGDTLLNTPLYRALRRAVSDPELGEPLVASGDLHSFDRDALIAWQGRLARRVDLRDWLGGGPERERGRLWMSIAHEQADWGARHVFGNLRPGEDAGGAPFLSLDSLYIEPLLKPVSPEGKPSPALKLLREQVDRHPAVVVRADFGMGKSLTARRLTRDLSREWLDQGGRGWLPLFVRCADDLRDRNFDIKQIVRRAAWRVLRGAGLDLPEDEAPDRLPLEHRVLVVLDGLDEVQLGPRDLQEFFRGVEAACSASRHFLVLSRPGALPEQLPPETSLFEVRLFDNKQIWAWLAAWQRVRSGLPAPTLEVLRERKLLGLAATPVLLLMIAWAWDGAAVADQGEIYERFMRSLARGKVELDRAKHPVVAKAGERLAESLRRVGELDQPDPVDAMLWLLSAAAWRARELAYERSPRLLDTHELGELVRGVDRQMDNVSLDAVRLGVVLALQLDPHGGTSTVLFGHRSFAEYLCARWWELRLQRALNERKERDREPVVERLGHAPLAVLDGGVDRTLEFLLGRIGRWGAVERRRLQEWTIDLLTEPPSDGVFYLQRGWQLRRSLLTVASQLHGWAGWRVSNDHAPFLRALLAWPQVAELWSDRLVARCLVADRLILAHTDLLGADLSGASLSGAYLSDANLSGANLSDANLSGANLSGANLSGANLSDTNLSGVNLSNAYLFGANLSGANLSGANLSGANLLSTNLSGANLSGVILTQPTIAFLGRDRVRWTRRTIWPDGFALPSGAVPDDR